MSEVCRAYAGHGQSRRGRAWHGLVSSGSGCVQPFPVRNRISGARCGMARLGTARRGIARADISGSPISVGFPVLFASVWPGMVRQGSARPGKSNE